MIWGAHVTDYSLTSVDKLPFHLARSEELRNLAPPTDTEPADAGTALAGGWWLLACLEGVSAFFGWAQSALGHLDCDQRVLQGVVEWLRIVHFQEGTVGKHFLQTYCFFFKQTLLWVFFFPNVRSVILFKRQSKRNSGDV